MVEVVDSLAGLDWRAAIGYIAVFGEDILVDVAWWHVAFPAVVVDESSSVRIHHPGPVIRETWRRTSCSDCLGKGSALLWPTFFFRCHLRLRYTSEEPCNQAYSNEQSSHRDRDADYHGCTDATATAPASPCSFVTRHFTGHRHSGHHHCRRRNSGHRNRISCHQHSPTTTITTCNTANLRITENIRLKRGVEACLFYDRETRFAVKTFQRDFSGYDTISGTPDPLPPASRLSDYGEHHQVQTGSRNSSQNWKYFNHLKLSNGNR